MAIKLSAPVSSYNPYERSVTVIASTPNPTDATEWTEGGTLAAIEERLVGWDLERFLKNPVVLWGHDQYCPPIGKASNIEVMPDGGLKMKLTLVHPGVSDLADQVAGSLQDDVLRAVSVGFVPGATTKNADGTVTRTNNELLEVSFVSVPADEDAGTPELNPQAEEDRKRSLVSQAASALAKHRTAVRAAKRAAEIQAPCEDDMRTDSVARYDVGGRLERAKRTSIGGAYIPARITRTGVLKYHLPSGTVRRELRHPDEVFKADSLATLDSIPVIDIRDHTAILTPADYKRAAVGHLKTYRHDAKFIEAELVVQDEATLDAIDAGERTEISCGYSCKLDMSSGIWNGEAYDCVQRDIHYNHVALCPPNRGRAGSEVGLRLDTNPGAQWGVTNITDGEIPMKVIKLDGTDFEFGSDAHIAKLDSLSAAAVTKAKADTEAAFQVKLDAAEAKVTSLTKERDEVQGKFDAKSTELETYKTDAIKAKRSADEEMEAKAKSDRDAMRAKVRLVNQVMRFFLEGGDGEDEDDKESDDEKMDALLDKSDRDLMLEVISKVDPKFDAKDKSDDYVRSRFDSTLDAHKSARERGVDAVARAAHDLTQTKTNDLPAHFDSVEKARKARDDRAANAWKTKS